MAVSALLLAMFMCVCLSVCFFCLSFLCLLRHYELYVYHLATSFDGHFYVVPCLFMLFQFITTVYLLLANKISGQLC